MKRIDLLLLIPLVAAFALGARSQHAELVRRHPVLPINFDHGNHGSINCVTCHHDFTDQSASASPTGSRTCVLCHKESPALALTLEHDFHQLCENCHLQRLRNFQQAGPVRSCKGCHTPANGVASADPFR
ncbi:cytochrome c3 family protein [Pseudomonas panipatensis]|jgi:hypothetical protein|uniref:cytochrome c3 family protein n=1 Tax=Pseudomonas panipatensis TaxID=428992 RepID=UPI0035B1BF6C